MFLDFLGKQAGSLLSCFSRHDYKCLETLKKRALSTIDDLVGVLPSPQVSWGKIN